MRLEDKSSFDSANKIAFFEWVLSDANLLKFPTFHQDCHKSGI